MVPQARALRAERDGAVNTCWVYILASEPYGTLCIGVTNDFLGRVRSHLDGTGSKFRAAMA